MRVDGIIILDPNGKPLITSNFAAHPPAYPAVHIDAYNHELARVRAEATAASSSNGSSGGAAVAELDPVLWVNALGRTGTGAGAALCHLERDGLRYLVPLSDEVNPLFAFAFLESFLDTLREYLGEVTEVTVKDNFEIVYMLIEEMLDEGHPMTMEPSMLKEIVLPPSLMRKLLNVAGVSGLQSHTTAPYTAPIPWRRSAVRHANNEIYFDLVETLDAIADRRGNVIQSSVWGRVNVNSRLSGNPDLVLRFTNGKAMGDPAFHPCIRYSRWERDGALSFIPPDGKFKLVDYSAGEVSQLPVSLKAKMTVDDNGGRFALTLTPRVTARPIEDIVVSIFLGSTTTSISATPAGDRRPLGLGRAQQQQEGAVDGHVGGGTAEFDPHTQILRWTISSLVASERPPTLTGSFVSSSRPTPDPSFNVAFSISNYSFSGMRVDQLKVAGDVGYKPFKGVRTSTRAGRVEVRW